MSSSAWNIAHHNYCKCKKPLAGQQQAMAASPRAVRRHGLPSLPGSSQGRQRQRRHGDIPARVHLKDARKCYACRKCWVCAGGGACSHITSPIVFSNSLCLAALSQCAATSHTLCCFFLCLTTFGCSHRFALTTFGCTHSKHSAVMNRNDVWHCMRCQSP